VSLKSLFLALLVVAAVSPVFLGAFGSFLTLDCGFASTSRLINATATFYSSDAPSCVPMEMRLTLPNGTVSMFSPFSCQNGRHVFVLPAGTNGLFTLNASYSRFSSSCVVAALYSRQRPRVPELPPAAVVLAGLVSAALFAKSRR